VNDRSVSIDLSALAGRGQLKPGDKVRISSGLYAGETATVESVSGGVIPAVLVRTEAGVHEIAFFGDGSLIPTNAKWSVTAARKES